MFLQPAQFSFLLATTLRECLTSHFLSSYRYFSSPLFWIIRAVYMLGFETRISKVNPAFQNSGCIQLHKSSWTMNDIQEIKNLNFCYHLETTGFLCHQKKMENRTIIIWGNYAGCTKNIPQLKISPSYYYLFLNFISKNGYVQLHPGWKNPDDQQVVLRRTLIHN